jgi:MSHA biogenesis protein MshP
MSQRIQRGFTIVSAIFILVVLAALGAAILTVSTSQQIGSALDVQGSRAYHAARAGLEWGLYKVLQDTNFASNTATATTNQLSAGSGCSSTNSAAPTSTTISPLPAPTLAGFAVVVTCYASHDNTNMGPWVYVIESTASSGTVGSATYVERRVKVSF